MITKGNVTGSNVNNIIGNQMNKITHYIHQTKPSFVINFFIKSVPQYAFRHFLHCHQRGSLEFLHRPMFLSYIRTVGVVYGNIITIFVVISLYKIVQ